MIWAYLNNFYLTHMVYFLGYQIKKFMMFRIMMDILIILAGIWGFFALGLQTNSSTTPEQFSPMMLGGLTAFLMACVVFSVGLYHVPHKYPVRNMVARILTVFVIVLPLQFGLWYSAGFDYAKILYVPIVVLSLQCFLLLTVRFVYFYLLPSDIFSENILYLYRNDHEEQEIYDLYHKTGEAFHLKSKMRFEQIADWNGQKFISFCRQHHIKMIVLGNDKPATILDNLIDIKFSGFQILDISLLQEHYLGIVNLNKLYSYHLLFSNYFSMSIFNQTLKRIFDIMGACLILSFMFPVLAVVISLIYLSDRQSVFYKQQRVGKDGKNFWIWKLRSMRIDAEADGKAKWADLNDTRITPIGAWIRRTRIDELPQCWNIIKGDMSLIGPRPERPEFVKQLQQEIPLYSQRHHLKPGLTGWAQINERYGASVADSQRKLAYDLYYLKHHNLLFDMLILLRTVSVVLWPNGVR